MLNMFLIDHGHLFYQHDGVLPRSIYLVNYFLEYTFYDQDIDHKACLSFVRLVVLDYFYFEYHKEYYVS